jgi:CspA family cold shock protein
MSAAAVTETGTVRWWNTDRGFGFIGPDRGGKDVFVHHAGVVLLEDAPRADLEDGARVTFTRGESPDGRPCAVDVRPID